MHVLVLSVSAGAGHIRAAEALVKAAEARGWSATHLDLLTVVPHWFKRVYSDTYLKLVARHPRWWAVLYRLTDRERTPGLRGVAPSALDRLRRSIEARCARRLPALIAIERPDAILCTHFLPAQVLSQCLGRHPNMPSPGVVITDFDVHGMWVQSGMHGFTVAGPVAAARLAERLQRRGLSAPIFETGIPIMPPFRTGVPDADTVAAARRSLGISSSQPVVLVMGGGHGVGAVEVIAEGLLERTAATVVVLAGRNEALLSALRDRAEAHGEAPRLIALGFTNTPEVPLAAADLVVSKPGGLTMSECLAYGRPLIAVGAIPGQEERNAEILAQSGAGLACKLPHEAVALAMTLLLDAPRLLRMSAIAANHGHPRAAEAVLNALVTGTSAESEPHA